MDFSLLVRSADQTRRKAINILNNLYDRVQDEEHNADPVPKSFSRATTAASIGSAQATLAPRAEDGPQAIPAKEKRGGFWRRGSSKEETHAQTLPIRPSSSIQADEHDGPIRRPTQNSMSATPSPNPPPQSPSDIRRTNTTTSSSDNTTRLSVSSTPSILSPSISPAQQRLSTHPITDTNSYSGLCKASFHALNLNLSKSIQQSIKSYIHAYHCRKCKYRLPAYTPDRNTPPRFDDRIFRVDQIRFRLMFLLKSHMPQKTNGDHRAYRCLFCVLSTPPTTASDSSGLGVYRSEAHLFEHISRHQGQVLGDTLLSGALELTPNGVAKSHLNDFDIFFPVIRQHHSPRVQPQQRDSLAPLTLPPPLQVTTSTTTTTSSGSGAAAAAAAELETSGTRSGGGAVFVSEVDGTTAHNGDMRTMNNGGSRAGSIAEGYSPHAIEWSADEIFGNVWS